MNYNEPHHVHEHAVEQRKKRRRYQRVLTLLVCVVAFCTVYALCLPAATLEKDAQDLPEHVHGETCYDESGILVCELEEAPSEGATELPASENTIAGNTDPATNEALKPNGAVDGVISDTNATGALKVQLLYSDKRTPAENPYGESAYTRSSMTGYLKIMPENLTGSLNNVTVKLRVPKAYVEKDTIKISDFISDAGEHTILELEETEDFFEAGIFFPSYNCTHTVEIPFSLSFLDEKAPTNYVLNLAAVITYNNTEYFAPETQYRPLYLPYTIAKFVNSNVLWAFQQDGAEVLVKSVEPGGNPCLGDEEDVIFQFVPNAYNYKDGCAFNSLDYRDLCQITLTDTLPTYKDVDGNTRTAVLSVNNSGWIPSADGKSVSKVYVGDSTHAIINSIQEDSLRLWFPQLAYEIGADNFRIARLSNTVSMEGVPSGAFAGEPNVTASKTLHFTITTNVFPAGIFSKHDTGNIYDTTYAKTEEYPWSVQLHNAKGISLEHLVIRDRHMDGSNEGDVSGVDTRLKFTKLRSFSDYSFKLAEGQTYYDVIDHVTAYYYDGTVEELPVSKPDYYGQIQVIFDPNKECSGYEIVFKDDYAMGIGEGVSFYAYTVYRNPDTTHANPDASSQENVYKNEAGFVSQGKLVNGQDYCLTAKMKDDYILNPVVEQLTVNLSNYGNAPNKNDQPGDRFLWQTFVSGSLLDYKQYEDLQMTILLPAGLVFDGFPGYQQSIFGYPDEYINKVQIIENYHNSGRSAIIFPLEAEKVSYAIQSTYDNQARLNFFTKITTDAAPGYSDTYVYITSKELPNDVNKAGFTQDTYDLDSDGSTDDWIASGMDQAYVTTASSIYSEKLIALDGSSNWTKQGLTIKAGSAFQYKLRVKNDTDSVQKNLVVYDVLPRIGDQSVLQGAKLRNSEFSIQLRGAIEAPAGYTVWYTTAADVYGATMAEMVGRDVWRPTIETWSEVTAFKIVANEGTELASKQAFEVIIPVRAEEELSDASMDILRNKEAASYLQANNAFGYTTDIASNPAESNIVWARIPFADFTLKKVDSEDHTMVLQGAEFTLKNSGGAVIQTGTTDENGRIHFKCLTEGTYTLTETKAPAGYLGNNGALTVNIVLNPISMTYEITFSENLPGAGTADNPLIVENKIGIALPATGGFGTGNYTVGGVALIAAALSILLYQHIKRKRVRDTAD